MFVLLLF